MMRILRISGLALMVLFLAGGVSYAQTAEEYLDKGVEYGAQGETDKAIAEYKKAIAINPNYAEAHYSLGAVYGAKGMIAEYKKAIAINPKDTEALRVALKKGRMPDEEIAEYKKALAINPNDAKMHYNLFMTYYYKEQYGLAIEHCDRAIELGYEVLPEVLEVLKPYRK